MGRQRHTMEQRKSHYGFIEVQKQLLCTCQAKTVVGSSVIPPVALIVPLLWHRIPYSGLA